MKNKILALMFSILFITATLCSCAAPTATDGATPLPASTETSGQSAAQEAPAAEPAGAQPTAKQSQTSETAEPQDDFFTYINADFINSVDMAKDGPRAMHLKNAQNKAGELLINDLKRMAKAGKPDEGAEYLSEAVKLFDVYTDMDSRNKVGAKPLIDSLKDSDAIKSVDDISDNYVALMSKVILPAIFAVTVDLSGEERVIALLSSVPPYLPSEEYYDTSNEQNKELTDTLEECLVNLMMMTGANEQDAKGMVEDALEIDRFFGEHMLDTNASREIMRNGDMASLQELNDMCKNLALGDAADILFEGKVDEIKVANPDLIRDLDKIVNDGNLAKLKNWIKVTMAKSGVKDLSEDFYFVMEPFNTKLNGTEPETPPLKQDVLEKAALENVKTFFPNQLSYYYGSTYLDEKTIEDISDMMQGMVGEYKRRLQNNDWLSDETRDKAILKLDNMKTVIGYDKNMDVSNPVTIKSKAEGGTLFDALDVLSNYTFEQNFKDIDLPYEDYMRKMTANILPSYEANANYLPIANTITINAAILQAPMYDKNASDAQNYGAIGTVIGHELSHAFDQNGSLYDENGKMTNWWTDEDRAKFDDLSSRIVVLFDGLEAQGGKVNGELTVTENTADAGGLSVAYDVLLANNPDADIKEFIDSYGHQWAEKMTDEYARQLILTDIHAPSNIRVNRQLSNFEPFYEVYTVSQRDGMYLAPEDRVSIW